MADLAARRRRDYAQAQPQFWREAEGAEEAQRAWFLHLVEDARTLTLVAEREGSVVGLLIAGLVDPPPVYDPGGPSGFIDDFVVGESADWGSEGRDLLAAAREWLREHGAAQVVVVSGFHDQPKRDLLDAEGLSVASTWHVAGLGPDDASRHLTSD